MIQQKYPIVGSRGRSQKLLKLYILYIGIDPLSISCIFDQPYHNFRVLSRSRRLPQ